MKFSWKNILPHLIAIGVFLLVTLIYCKPALQGKVLQQDDLQQWQGMSKSSFDYKDTHGHFPLWVNSMFGGMPGFQIAMDSENPVSIGFIHKIITLFLPAPFSFFFLMCLSFYFLSQVLKVDYRLGILGSIGYAYASFTPIIVTVGHVTQAMALGYMPALLAAVFLVFQKKYWTGAALCTILAGLFIAQNHLQVTYYFILIAAIATIAYTIKWIRNKEYKHLIISYGIFAVAAVTGFAINMVTLATTYDFGQATMRGGSQLMDTTGGAAQQSSGLPIDYAFQWSYGQAETFSLLVPNIYGGVSSGREFDASSHVAKEYVSVTNGDSNQGAQFASQFPAYWGDQPFTSGPVYLGAIMCLLFVLGIIYYKGYDKWWIVIACALAILMCWGKNFMGFNELLFNYLPLYNKFRVPTMTLVIPQLLFPMLAMLVLQQLIFTEKNSAETVKKLKLTGYIMLGLFALTAMLYISFDYKSSEDSRLIENLTQMTKGNTDIVNRFYNALKLDRQSLFGKDILRSLFFAAAGFLILWLFVKNKIKAVHTVFALLLLASIDVITQGRRYMNENSFTEKTTADANAFTPTKADNIIKTDKSYYRVLNLTVNPFNDAITSYFHNSVGGYSPVKLSITEDLLNFHLRKYPMNQHVLD
ncbi:MAG TPA: hypothetical protein PL045_08405, partial [Chitinophagaceae bacterium]|nr:hypothetical protein [Chitinophagaceae bacterium]